MGQWAKLVDKLSDELGKLRMACRHCNAPMSEATVNAVCPVTAHNPATTSDAHRHYFVKVGTPFGTATNPSMPTLAPATTAHVAPNTESKRDGGR
jgi:hypothetical protein